LSIRRYVALSDERPLRYRRAADYIQHFRQLLDRATEDRLRTNCAGILMSGGLDSTCVAASAKRLLDETGAPYDLRAYTWVYTRLLRDEERHYSGMAAKQLGIPVEFLEADEPTLNPLASSQNGRRSPLQLVSDFGRVMLSGLGGDPALYPDREYWLRLLGRGHIGRLWGDLAQHVRFGFKLPPFYLRPNLGRWLGRPVWRPPYPTWLRADAAIRLDLRNRLEKITDERLSDRGRTGMISPFWSNLLANRDPDHTGVPVKMRHPFFDVRLIRYLMRIPAVPWFVDKRLLRESAKDTLPDAVRLRPKTLMASWPHHAMVMKEGVPEWMENLARTPELRRYVDVDTLRRTLHSPAQMADYEYQAAVRALTLAIWLRREGLSTAGGFGAQGQ
jgi:asparagine synthase (glutamine-hydrolysing)